MSQIGRSHLGALPKAATALLKRLGRISTAGYERRHLRDEAERLLEEGPMPAASFWSIVREPPRMKQYMHEIRAILAIYIGEVWALIDPRTEAGDREITERITRGALPLDAICAYCFLSFRRAAAQWLSAQAVRDQALFHRLAQFTEAARRAAERSGGEAGDPDPGAAIARGGMTGAKIVIGLEEVIPRLWQRKFSGVMPHEELFKALQPAALAPVLAVWKGMKGEVVNAFEVRATERMQPVDGELTRYVFREDAFELVRSEAGVWLPVPSEQSVAGAESLGARRTSSYVYRSGCPADAAGSDRAASGPSEMDPVKVLSVLDRTAEWILQLSRRHWLPRFDTH